MALETFVEEFSRSLGADLGENAVVEVIEVTPEGQVIASVTFPGVGSAEAEAAEEKLNRGMQALVALSTNEYISGLGSLSLDGGSLKKTFLRLSVPPAPPPLPTYPASPVDTPPTPPSGPASPGLGGGRLTNAQLAVILVLVACALVLCTVFVVFVCVRRLRKARKIVDASATAPIPQQEDEKEDAPASSTSPPSDSPNTSVEQRPAAATVQRPAESGDGEEELSETAGVQTGGGSLKHPRNLRSEADDPRGMHTLRQVASLSKKSGTDAGDSDGEKCEEDAQAMDVGSHEMSPFLLQGDNGRLSAQEERGVGHRPSNISVAWWQPLRDCVADVDLLPQHPQPDSGESGRPRVEAVQDVAGSHQKPTPGKQDAAGPGAPKTLRLQLSQPPGGIVTVSVAGAEGLRKSSQEAVREPAKLWHRVNASRTPVLRLRHPPGTGGDRQLAANEPQGGLHDAPPILCLHPPRDTPANESKGRNASPQDQQGDGSVGRPRGETGGRKGHERSPGGRRGRTSTTPPVLRLDPPKDAGSGGEGRQPAPREHKEGASDGLPLLRLHPPEDSAADNEAEPHRPPPEDQGGDGSVRWPPVLRLQPPVETGGKGHELSPGEPPAGTSIAALLRLRPPEAMEKAKEYPHPRPPEAPPSDASEVLEPQGQIHCVSASWGLRPNSRKNRRPRAPEDLHHEETESGGQSQSQVQHRPPQGSPSPVPTPGAQGSGQEITIPTASGNTQQPLLATEADGDGSGNLQAGQAKSAGQDRLSGP